MADGFTVSLRVLLLSYYNCVFNTCAVALLAALCSVAALSALCALTSALSLLRVVVA